MRVISGFLKGRNIEGYNTIGTRPTMDRVKESLFGMIQDYIKDSICLDLFSGSGNLGIEAISQGASFVYLNDFNKKAVNVIKKNIDSFNISNYVTVLNMKYQQALKFLEDKKIDIIFLDPPYDTDYIEQSINLIEKYDLLNDDGIIVCESSEIEKIVYSNNFIKIKSKRYGDKLVVILKKV